MLIPHTLQGLGSLRLYWVFCALCWEYSVLWKPVLRHRVCQINMLLLRVNGFAGGLVLLNHGNRTVCSSCISIYARSHVWPAYSFISADVHSGL